MPEFNESESELRALLEKTVGSQGDALRFETFRFSPRFDACLKLSAELLAARIGAGDLTETLVAVLRLMALNALRANVKEVVFRENGFDSANPDQYRTGLSAFRIALTAGHAGYFESFVPRFKELKMPIELGVALEPGRVVVEALNHFTLQKNDLMSIQKKLERANGGQAMFQFFEEAETDPTSQAAIARAVRALDEKKLRARMTVQSDRDNGTTSAILILVRPDVPADQAGKALENFQLPLAGPRRIRLED